MHFFILEEGISCVSYSLVVGPLGFSEWSQFPNPSLFVAHMEATRKLGIYKEDNRIIDTISLADQHCFSV